MLVDLQEPVEAADALAKALRQAPNSPESHYSLSLVYRRLGKLSEASRELRLAQNARRRREAADAAIVSTQGGIRQLERGEFEAAAAQFRAVIANQPDFAPAYYQLSLALRKLGHEQESAAFLQPPKTGPGSAFLPLPARFALLVAAQTRSGRREVIDPHQIVLEKVARGPGRSFFQVALDVLRAFAAGVAAMFNTRLQSM